MATMMETVESAPTKVRLSGFAAAKDNLHVTEKESVAHVTVHAFELGVNTQVLSKPVTTLPPMLKLMDSDVSLDNWINMMAMQSV